jgi:ferrochelatase
MAVQMKPSAVQQYLADYAREIDTAREPIGIVLLNLGGPTTLDDVEPFLYNLFNDPEIITLPSFVQWLNGPVAWLIAKGRAPSSREGYAAIGGGSPQLSTTEAQGKALEEALAARGVAAKSYVAMRYWQPYTSDCLAALKRDGIQRVVVLPLYPQFSISTSGSSLRLLEKEFYEDPALRQTRNTVIPAWYNRQGYINSLSRLIEEKLQKFDDPSSAHVFFSAHGLPVKYVETLGDPYQTQTEATVDFCMARLRALGYTNSHTLAYQSRLGPVQWLQPYTDEKIRELGAAGTTKMVVVPVSFVSEHIETLEEIDMEYAELAAECGVTQWERVPTIGLDGEFIDDLASAVIEALPKMDEQPLQEINEGRPVSLRVVNDLVQLKSKDTLALFDEFGPIRYNAPQRVGFTTRAELINGRIAMVAITAASALSISQGNFWDRVLDGALPFQFW